MEKVIQPILIKVQFPLAFPWEKYKLLFNYKTYTIN